MANIDYPDGTGAFATLATDVDLTASSVAIGSIGLGDGEPTVGTKAATGVVFLFDVAKNSSDNLVVSFQASNDGTNWFDMDVYGFTWASFASTQFRVHVEPFTFGANRVRVLVNTGTVGGTAGTVTLKARLTDVYKAVGR